MPGRLPRPLPRPTNRTELTAYTDLRTLPALAPGLRATNLNPRAAAAGSDPAEAAAAAIRLALLADDGPTGELFSWDGARVPW